NIWLWSQWSFEEPLGMSLLLILNSLFLIYLCGAPLWRSMKLKSIKSGFNSWIIKTVFYLMLVATIVLCVTHFYGWIRILLPIKFFLMIVLTFVKYKRKKLFFQKQA
ncbi:MAG: hypothetical protein MJK18_03885, partial [Bdellovibrionales bacterium]|nr:hypothetical protein [Bdellovibrionales bacterium]